MKMNLQVKGIKQEKSTEVANLFLNVIIQSLLISFRSKIIPLQPFTNESKKTGKNS